MEEIDIMSKPNQIWTKDGFILRPARAEDAKEYFYQKFNPLDSEVHDLRDAKKYLHMMR